VDKLITNFLLNNEIIITFHVYYYIVHVVMPFYLLFNFFAGEYYQLLLSMHVNVCKCVNLENNID